MREGCTFSKREIIRKEYEIVEDLSREFNIISLCFVMNISRSGYYKWLNRKNKLNIRQKNRILLKEMIINTHNNHKSFGYRRITSWIRNETGWYFSTNLCHKLCKELKIVSLSRKNYHYIKPGNESIKFKNLVNGNFNVDRPFELVVTDTTIIHTIHGKYDWTFYLDVFNNEIVGSDVSRSFNGNNVNNHYKALNNFLNNKIKRGYKDQDTTLHSDQGSIYSSIAFNMLLEHYTIKRSMSRAGTPTDNPVIESLNGWIKEELYLDFNLYKSNNVIETINNYISYYNNKRGSYKLNYKSPVQYRIEQGF